MSILTKQTILELINREDIIISPFNEKQLNPCSYDVRLGNTIKVYSKWIQERYVRCINQKIPFPMTSKEDVLSMNDIIDIKDHQQTISYKMDDNGFLLIPGVFYLMHTQEKVCAKKHVPTIDGKSSIGRLGIKIHFSAGVGDPGFDGQYTLEVEVAGPIMIYPGIRFGQIRFFECVGEVEDYKLNGHYVGSTAQGAIDSKAYQQILEDNE